MGENDLERVTRIVAERAAALVLYGRQWLDAASAEDAVQNALTALLAQRQAPRNPLAWMYRAVRNAAIDEARRNHRRRRRERAVAETRSGWFEARAHSPMDARFAEEALRQLSEPHREIVVLRIWSGLGFAEIAAITETSISTVHDRYVSALKQLRAILERSCKNKMD